MAVSVHPSSLSLFDSCESMESNSINFSANDIFDSNTALFGWSDIPCHDENEFLYPIDDVYPSHCDFVSSMDDNRPVLSNLFNSTIQSRMIQSESNSRFDMTKCNKALHERSLSSVDSIPDTIPTKKLRTKTTFVRFSDTITVREYNIVPTIHPCCVDGLAIELGWDYTDVVVPHESTSIVKTSTIQQHRPAHESSTVSRRSRCSKSINSLRLNYFERRERLERMTGKSELQMLRELHDS
jgi:hypothetical protein